MRLLLIMSALLVLTACTASAGVIYNTGESTTIWDNNALVETWLGMTSGYVDAARPSRRTSMDFVLDLMPGQVAQITGITAYWFDNADNGALLPYVNLGWAFYTANPGNMGPIPPPLAIGSVPKTSIVNDPFGGDPRTWKHTFDITPTMLPSGEYYLTLFGIEGAIAWLTGAPDGPMDLKFYRSLTGDDFAAYTLPAQFGPKVGQDPEDCYHLGFILYGSIVPEPATTSLLAGSLLMLGAFLRKRR